jgi:hypothetical protein
MALQRKIEEDIKAYLSSDSNKMMIIDGVRQVGKSFILSHLLLGLGSHHQISADNDRRREEWQSYEGAAEESVYPVVYPWLDSLLLLPYLHHLSTLFRKNIVRWPIFSFFFLKFATKRNDITNYFAPLSQVIFLTCPNPEQLFVAQYVIKC